MFANILGPDAVIIVVLVVVLIFGANKLPKLARNVGEAGKEFRKARSEAEAANQELAKPSVDNRVTLRKSDLDAVLAEREAKARREATAARDTETPPAN